jgi:hypothetical protein
MCILRRYLLGCILIVFLGYCGCAYHQTIPSEQTDKIYMAEIAMDDLVSRFSPVFLTYGHRNEYNRIGRPSADYDDRGRERIHVNTKEPVIYYKITQFTASKGVYTNYVYRIHFPGIPFSIIPFHLTAGKNVGLMVIVTVDILNRPVLISTVHTCGCYVSIVPTSYLPRDAFPENWKEKPLKVYGERLPCKLEYTDNNDQRVFVHLRPGVHRVMNLEIIENQELNQKGEFGRIVTQLLPMEDLNAISMDGKTTSFYYKEGVLKGHVKGSIKYWESIFMSLISLDLFVGMDKAYSDTELTGNPFYTSLKPWNRISSNMWDFAGFLEFWGWRL